MKPITVFSHPDGGASVSVSGDYVRAWVELGRWPCLEIDNHDVERGFTAVFDPMGNLVELNALSDNAAMSALTDEAQTIAVLEGALTEQLTMTPERLAATVAEILPFRAAFLSANAQADGERRMAAEAAPSSGWR